MRSVISVTLGSQWEKKGGMTAKVNIFIETVVTSRSQRHRSSHDAATSQRN